MTDFSTPVKIPDSSFKIGYSSSVMSIGSCFANNMGSRLQQLKFNIDLNPFGVLYNPVSINHSLTWLNGRDVFSDDFLFYHNSLWHSFYHHGDFSSSDREATLNHINTRLESARRNLKRANVLIITLGTSWVYEYLATGEVVSNCHKVPDQQFRRYRLSVEQIVEQLSTTFKNLRRINPQLQVILSVSPIRHLKDTAHGNQLSKATLLLATEQLVSRFPNVQYFPAYEIMMDELRDYRFYADDMVHPSKLAIDFIWERFSDAYIDKRALPLMKQLSTINNALNHRPINPQSPAHLEFLQKELVKISKLQAAHPEIDLSAETAYLRKALKKEKVG